MTDETVTGNLSVLGTATIGHKLVVQDTIFSTQFARLGPLAVVGDAVVSGTSSLQALLVFAALTIVLTQVMSNTAAVAMVVPITISTDNC